MPLINKPQNINKIWSNSGDRATPSDQKINQGWVPEIPPHQWFNYIDNKQDQAIAHINQMGIPQWDAVTEYQANKSYVQGPTNGVVYKATQTHINQNPEVSSGYWEVAFLTQAPDYDTTYVRLNQNLADVPNKTQARNNLGMYSKAEVDTKIQQALSQVQSVGIGQTWVDMSSTRNTETNYTNTTGRAIMVSVTINSSDSGIEMLVGGIVVARSGQQGGSGNDINYVQAIIPPNAVYRANRIRGLANIVWAELR